MDMLAIAGWMWLIFAAYWFVAARFVKATKLRETRLHRLQHVIPLAIGFFLIFQRGWSGILWGRLYASRPVAITGIVVTAAGLLFAVWARVHLGRNWSGIVTLKQDHELIQSGPYRFVRHPIYTGYLTAVLGAAIVAETGDALVGFAIILVALLFKMGREETFMTREFGDEYQEYKQRVARLVPYVY
jgi:protein-S-isoprenylcysteine O-methyltransferase Ste14